MLHLQLSQVSETFRDLVDEPDKRFQRFFDYYCNVKLNSSFGIERYVRSGREMLRMANIYFKEQDTFHAFVIYSRYAVLFGEKLRQHPAYKQLERADLAELNRNVREIALPRAEQLKVYIKERFAAEANESAVARQKLAAAAKPDTTKPTDGELTTLGYEELKRKYNTLNENELRDLIAKQQQEKRNNSKDLSISAPSANTKGDGRPTFDRSLKPPSQQEKEHNKYNLRTVIVPFDLPKRFMEMAQANTSRNVETCGILGGCLAKNKFVITHCILPKQKGTSDTCSTEQEHELCEVIDEHNLITLGWIHTHPSQTAFLSSIDLHTHFGYQIMLPESIAIVCAPSYDQVGYFILSPDSGLKEIGECSVSGFHPHTNYPPLFEECDHVVVDNKQSISIIDLRMVSSRN